MQYVDQKSIITPDGTELVEVNVIKALGEFFTSSKVYVRLSTISSGAIAKIGPITLTANATSTTVPAPLCVPTSFVQPIATDLVSANALPFTVATAGNGQFVVTHPNSAVTKIFNFAIFI